MPSLAGRATDDNHCPNGYHGRRMVGRRMVGGRMVDEELAQWMGE